MAANNCCRWWHYQKVNKNTKTHTTFFLQFQTSFKKRVTRLCHHTTENRFNLTSNVQKIKIILLVYDYAISWMYKSFITWRKYNDASTFNGGKSSWSTNDLSINGARSSPLCWPYLETEGPYLEEEGPYLELLTLLRFTIVRLIGGSIFSPSEYSFLLLVLVLLSRLIAGRSGQELLRLSESMNCWLFASMFELSEGIQGYDFLFFKMVGCVRRGSSSWSSTRYMLYLI